MVTLEQVASLEGAHKDAGQQVNQALGQLAEEEQQRKEAERKLLELNEELNSTAELLRKQRVAANQLKEENAEQAATIASFQTALTEAEQKKKAAEDELTAVKAGVEEARDEGYNQGLDETEAFYQKEFAEAKKFLFAQGWEAALKAAGRPEGDALYKDIIFPPEPAPASETAQAETSAAATAATEQVDAPTDAVGEEEGIPIALPD